MKMRNGAKTKKFSSLSISLPLQNSSSKHKQNPIQLKSTAYRDLKDVSWELTAKSTKE